MITTAREMVDAARPLGLRLGSDLQLDDTGADFRVGHGVDEQGAPWVLRAPRRPDVPERAADEHRVLRLLRTRLPVAVPDWRIFSPRLIAYPRLEGESAAVIDLQAGRYVWRFDATAPPGSFLDTLAGALASLHGIPREAAAGAGLRVEEPVQVRERWTSRMEEARGMLDVPDAVWKRWQAWLADDTFWPGHSVLIHGDLHPPHILVDDRHRVTGLIDWTEARVSDPAIDFALLFATLGGEALRVLLDRYGEAGGRVWPRMHDHVAETWSAFPAMIARFARESGDEARRELAQALVNANGAVSGGPPFADRPRCASRNTRGPGGPG